MSRKQVDLAARIHALGLKFHTLADVVGCSPSTISLMTRGGTSPRVGPRVLAVLERLEAERASANR
jgi:hypothetical protein